MKPADALTDKQRMFVREYLVDLNATQAAIRAGYSPKTAGATGHENLKKPEIARAIQSGMVKRESKLEISAERVLLELARLAFSDPRRLFDDQGVLRPIQDLDDDTAAALASVEVVEAEGGDGEPVSYVKKVRHWDKKGALELLGKHLSMFTDKLDIGMRLDPASLDPEERRALLALLEKAHGGSGEG